MEADYRTILVAVDESEQSMYALTWFLHNLPAQHKNCTLVLLYVKPPPPVVYSSLDPAGYLFGGDDAIANLEKYAKDLATSVMRKAEAICQNFDTKIKVEKKVGTGDAKDIICIAVKQLKADMLVMGSHNYGFFKRALLGSVSEHCAKHVKCPVVVVKRPQ